MFGASAEVLDILAERERIEAQLLAKVGEWISSGEWSADGGTPTSWLVHRGGMTGVEASRLVRNGGLVHKHDRTAKLLGSGDISSGHVDLMARAARHREDCFDQHEDALLDAARALPVEEFRTVARRWQVLADDVLATDDAAAVFERRHLHCSTTFHGTVRIDGMLDPEGGAIVMDALDRLMMPDPSQPAARRRADALLALAGGTRPRVNIDVVVDVETFAGGVPRDLAATRSDLDRVGPVARETVRRLACDGAIGRVVRRGRNEIVDVGRRSRLVTPALRRALELRDHTCVFPGCDRPHQWCDAHHVVHWVDGGTTDLDNLVLLCRRHHVTCHEGGVRFQRARDGTIEPRPL